MTDTTGGDTGGLIVSPRTALFDVRLYAGESEQRRATLTNASSEPVLVHLSSTVTDHWGPTGSTDQIMFAASTGDCPTTHDVALTSGQSIEHGRLEPGETRDICISVALLPDATDAPAGIATADLQFESIAIGEHLAETGTGIPALALGIAGATLLAGAMLAGTRKKTDNA
ncbi:LPXTG cell wall anchor domain-containing protein [Microbacterium sp. NPDC089695]|uniref:LPXTG cell wall anchor domain-containing protein n=1 Tax=Microbacterium sp. NPDC089695 TaxID=3364198 RepID=UPI0038291FF5